MTGSMPRRSPAKRLVSSAGRGTRAIAPGAYRVRRRPSPAMMTVDNTFALFGVISFDPGDSAGNVEFVEASPLTSVTLTFDGSPNGTVAFYDRDTTALPGSPIVTVVDPLVTQTITDPTVLAAMSTALATADTGVPAWSHLYMEAQPGVGSTGHLNITATV